LWLVLKYLMTPFDEGNDSDTVTALNLLGSGIRALQELSYLPLPSGLGPTVLNPLIDNPEPLKITFDEAPSDLLSKVMQGPDDKYRFSIAFQVRPVMIATPEPPAYSLLVGVDYTTPTPTITGDGVNVAVTASLGPRITALSPESFEVGSTFTITGSDLHLSGLSVALGPITLPIIAQTPEQLTCKVEPSIATGDAISAGSYPVSVLQALPKGKSRSSNLLIGNLLPTLTTAAIFGAVAVLPDTRVHATIDLTGVLLGDKDDDCFLALYNGAQTIKVFDAFTDEDVPPPPLPVPAQSKKRLIMTASGAVTPGTYLVIYRVNGQQAKNSPTLNLS
jgi:hypothetical protein